MSSPRSHGQQQIGVGWWLTLLAFAPFWLMKIVNPRPWFKTTSKLLLGRSNAAAVMGVVAGLAFEDIYLTTSGEYKLPITNPIVFGMYFVVLWGLFFLIFNERVTSFGEYVIKNSNTYYKSTSLGLGIAVYSYIVFDFLHRHP